MRQSLAHRVDELQREIVELRRLVTAQTALPIPSGPFTPERAAFLCGKTPSTIRKLAKRGAPWARRVGGRWLIDRSKFIEWVGAPPEQS